MSDKANYVESRKRSVDNLQRLYTVVISLSVTESLRRIITTADGATKMPSLSQAMAFGCLIITVIPFYHGANRHLDATYVTNERTAKPEALLVDFIILFLEGLIFFVMAMLMDDLVKFYFAIVTLLFLDVIWLAFITAAFTIREIDNFKGYKKWTVANILVALGVLVSAWSNIFKLWSSDTPRDVFIAILMVGRTLYDYKIAYKFYYPTVAETAP